MKNTKKKGFTIVELVIVIAVIGILSAILIPTFSGLVKNAQDVALQENLRNAYVEYTSREAGAGEYLGQDEVYFEIDGTVYCYDASIGEYKECDFEIGSDLLTVNEADETGSPSAEENSTYNGFVAYKLPV